MHIAIVTETYPPELNGVALTVESFVEHLSAKGHTIDLIRPEQAQSAFHALPAGVTTMTVSGTSIPRYPELRMGMPAGGKLRARWQKRRPDALYVATEGPLGWSAVRTASRMGIPTATGFHTRFDDFVAHYGARWLTPLVFAWLRRFHNRAQATLVPTRELEALLDHHGFDRVRLLARAVDTRRFDPSRRDAALRAGWGVDADGLAVIHVGRVAAEKNLDLVVRAFDAIRARVSNAKLIWIGDGPRRAELEAAHRDHVFCGFKRDGELAAHVASGDLFLFPSLTETFGNVTLEAMAAGVPVVAYDYGAAREHIVDGESGRALPRGDEAGFIAAAAGLALDAHGRKRMARAARDKVANLDPAAVAADLATLLGGLTVQTRAA